MAKKHRAYWRGVAAELEAKRVADANRLPPPPEAVLQPDQPSVATVDVFAYQSQLASQRDADEVRRQLGLEAETLRSDLSKRDEELSRDRAALNAERSQAAQQNASERRQLEADAREAQAYLAARERESATREPMAPAEPEDDGMAIKLLLGAALLYGVWRIFS